MLAIRVSNDVQGHSRAAVRPELEKRLFCALGRPLALTARHQAPAFTDRVNEIHHLSQASEPISTQVPCQTPRPESNSDKPETLDHYGRKVLLTYHKSQQKAPLNRRAVSRSTRLAAVALFPGPRTRAASEPSAHVTCTRLRFDITDRPATMALISPILPCH